MPTSLLHPELLAVRPNNMMLVIVAPQLHPHCLEVGVAGWRSHHLLWIRRPINVRCVVLTITFSSTATYSSSQTMVPASPPSYTVHLTLERRFLGTSDDVNTTTTATTNTIASSLSGSG
jgi:hypothetical protein